MKIWTWLEMKTKIEKDLDLEDEDFVTPTELKGYANEAIDACEQLFLQMNESYFKSETNLSLAAGVSNYSLPSDIYGTKILLVQYNNGFVKYPIKRLKDLKAIAYINTDEDYRYRLVNDALTGLQMKLYPTSRETSTTNVTVYYIRSANRIALDSDNVDMPEAANFIIQFVKDRVKEKERGTVGQEPSDALKAQKDLMISALVDQVEDEDTELPVDLSFYRGHY